MKKVSALLFILVFTACSGERSQTSNVYDSDANSNREWTKGIQLQNGMVDSDHVRRIVKVLQAEGIMESDIKSSEPLGGVFSRGQTRLGTRYKLTLADGSTKIVFLTILNIDAGDYIEVDRDLLENKPVRTNRDWTKGIQLQNGMVDLDHVRRIVKVLQAEGIMESDIKSSEPLGGVFSRGQTRLGTRYKLTLADGSTKIVFLTILNIDAGDYVE